jgi:radical SAM superfamily enzyme YgiQ (UPF0313 family)
MPEEAANHADYVIIGHADGPWQSFLEDFRKGKAQKFYQNLGDRPFRFPFPRRDLFKGKGYFRNAIMIVSRGCKYNCPACIIPIVDGKDMHLRPIDEVVRDIMRIDVENIYIADETPFFMGNKYKIYGRELFTALIPFKKKLFVNAVRIMSLNDEELKLAYNAGVKEVYLVFAYPPIALSLIEKSLEENVIKALKKIHDNGMEIFASFGLGFDFDNKNIFEKSVRFAHKAECDLAEFFIATPFPRTPFWTRLNDEGRLLHQDWGLYNSANVVFQPKNMKVDELYAGYIECWKEFYSRYSFDDFENRFSRYWGMNKNGVRRMHDKKRIIKEQDSLKDD